MRPTEADGRTSRAEGTEPNPGFADRLRGGHGDALPVRRTPHFTQAASTVTSRITSPMKNPRSLLFVIAAVAPAALLGTWGCSKSENSKAQDVAQDVKTTAKDVASDVKTAAVDTWDGIKDFTFEKRSDFSASIDRMAKGLDDKVADLKAKASTVPDAAAKDREAALKEYDEARADLKAKLADLGNATADGWADAKAKVAASWDKVQAAYKKATG
jgi:hypothetical protein